MKLHFFSFLLPMLLLNFFAEAARLKDIASIRGVRENQLIGYGIVVGLKGTGDGKNEFTSKSMARLLDKLGVKLDSAEVQSKNVAAVVVTATLPAFAKAGNPLDITVSAIGDSGSLQGGTLLQTPLRAGNEQVFAVAQGTVVISGDGGKDVHTTSGRIPNGAIIEKDVQSDFSSRKMFRLTLHNPDFTTAARSVLTINRELGGQYASAKDAGTIDIVTPFGYENKGVELLATIESIQINPDSRAVVIINEKSGTVVIGDKVKISKVAVSHNGISVKVGDSKGKGKGGDEKIALIEGASVGDLVQNLNKVGITPKDLITLLQAIKAAGALHGELEVL
ncbi:MAG: flagellar basal body P-ring protein FlgI [Bdellovibrionaceae bacterium]|nr:flagellar basal body P-ring protein FlgI [Pseudobdellovibrionaceae bacterium]